MSEGRTITRKEFLHGIFRHRTGNDRDMRSETPEPDYLAMLPPEFSGVMLEMEAARLGGDTATMTRNEMAALVVRAMYGEASRTEERQQSPGPAQEQERTPLD